ncbi:hypothetical protein [Pectinatus frisingensis]|uniref:hypothetical protein n=1 Tax=Pectinatus frisingensis TaxID=865 RepID=UPI0018C76099|nr:hypothetical protein [Pectinatus frisingensis]
MKFVEMADKEELRVLCIHYNLCTRMSCEKYSKMLNDFGENEGSLKKRIETASMLILTDSETDMTLENIAGAIFNRCIRRWADEENKD